MEQYLMFTDRKIQYCQDVRSSEIDPQNQCSQNQNHTKLYHMYLKIILKFIQRAKDTEYIIEYLKK